MWVDFLLKETEEREKRELSGSTGDSMGCDSRDKNTNSGSSPLSNPRFSTGTASITSPTNQNTSPLSHGYFQHSEQIGSEFSTVPLTYSDSKTNSSTLLPR
jgi:hypothetical protein